MEEKKDKVTKPVSNRTDDKIDDKIAKDNPAKLPNPDANHCKWCADREKLKQSFVYDNEMGSIWLRCRYCGDCQFNLKIENNYNLFAMCKCGNKVLMKKLNCECEKNDK